ncbi:MAG: hypothetical protein FWF58_01845, partial [Firmicutes bacterium]|nr:hypothetical protein [Bacillota bacterium]
MQNPNTTIRPKRKMTRKGSIIKFSILGAIVLIIALLSVISFDVPFISNGIYKFNSFASSINIGTDLKSGAYAVFEAKEVQNDEEVSNLPQRINETRDRFYTMLSDRGYPDANVSIEGITRIRAEVPDANDPSTIFQLVDKAAKLIVRAESDSDEKGDLVLGEKHLEKAWVRQTQGQYSVNVKFNKEGSAILSRLTNKGTATVVTRVEGQEDATVSLNNHISNGELSLSGSWANRSDAQNLVVQIMSGSFSTPMTILENDIITPTLGDIALPLAMLAGLLGVVAVMVYLCVVYKLLGVVASASILLFSVLMMFFLYFVP